MKKSAIMLTAAAILMNTAAQPVSADGERMNLRMSAAQTAFSVDALADGDAVTQGALYIDNYSGISQIRVILKSDAPLVIENGDFTRDPNQTGPDGEPKISFFTNYSTAIYTQKGVQSGRSNIALWYGEETGASDGNYYATGVIDQADSSFLSYDIRIPQGTPVGDYTCYISTDSRTITDTITEDDFFAFNRRQALVPGTDLTLTPVKLSVYRRGDVNCDGTVDIADAQCALKIYVETVVVAVDCTDEDIAALANTPHGYTARMAADASEDGTILLDDPLGILRYAVEVMVGSTPQWSDIYH